MGSGPDSGAWPGGTVCAKLREPQIEGCGFVSKELLGPLDKPPHQTVWPQPRAGRMGSCLELSVVLTQRPRLAPPSGSLCPLGPGVVSAG